MDFHFKPGTQPLLLSIPHVGTDVPDAIDARFAPCAAARADTDRHLDRLYAFAEELGVSLLSARWSRYLIDLNRPPEDSSLYPGRDTTGLCPVDTFARERLYRPGREPDADEIEERLARYWQPYHRQLQAELARLRALHGQVVLWDAHSIASRVPRFFDGRLPDLNFGSADGKSCAPALQDALQEALRRFQVSAAPARERLTFVFDGRFKGGHITRAYGRPEQGVHAIQLEMCQCLYMDEAPPFAYRPALAARVQPLLRALLQAALAWVRA
ncbi:N-formylglutamate deformylase [Massilia forsythiae]|uniref:N-formylglutamate deformylase n=1 Tax=Massilia forsythiae TaxID=2728020 RepID=A0A7Z2VWF4_9BURK|nr:N-formylglutamate deformylase [Massilia forsythiae]QJE00501.1 N-formylglutamate deformylase [Massilia forsythiae]